MHCKQYIPVDFDSIGEPVMACPVCGVQYVHPVGLECRSPGTAYGHVRVDNNGIHLNPEMPPLGRGVLLMLRFICEYGHGFDYEFHFHKGSTIVNRQTFQLADDFALHPKTIWRD